MFDNFQSVGHASTEKVEDYFAGAGVYVARLYRDAPTWALEEHGEGYEFDTYIARADLARRAIKALLLARWADHQAGYAAPVPQGAIPGRQLQAGTSRVSAASPRLRGNMEMTYH